MPPPHPLTTLILTPLLTTLALVYYLIFKLYKTIITSLTSNTPLSPYDSIFAVDNLNHPHAANATLIFLEDKVEFCEIKEKFLKLLKDPSLKKLNKTIVKFGGYFFFKEISENRHDNFYQKRVKNVEELYKVLGSEVMNGGFVGYLWDVWVFDIDSGGDDGRQCIVLRVHHTVADGYSQNHLIDKLLNCKSSNLVGNREKNGSSFYEKMLHLPTTLLTLYSDALTTPPDLFTSRKTSKTGYISMVKLDLDKYKQIRKLTESHFASIGMSLMGGALARFMKTKGEKLPEQLGVMHSLPRGGHPLLGSSEEEKQLCNHWGVGLFKVPLNETDPLERLLKTEKNFKSYMEKGIDRLLHYHMPLIEVCPAILLHPFFNLNFSTATGFTSVPAVSEEQSFQTANASSKVVSLSKIFGWQWSQTALATAVYTHKDVAVFSMFCNGDFVGSQEEMDGGMMGEVLTEFEGVYKSVVSGGGRSRFG